MFLRNDDFFHRIRQRLNTMVELPEIRSHNSNATVASPDEIHVKVQSSIRSDSIPPANDENGIDVNQQKLLIQCISLPSYSLDSSSDEESQRLLSEKSRVNPHMGLSEALPHPQHVLLLRQPYVSLEQLNPSHDCYTRKSTFVSALFNLVATVCGGGVLTLPLVFARAGILPTTFLMIYSALTTDFCLSLLVSCARRTGGRSYGDVAQVAFGSVVAQLVTTLSLATMLFGTLIAYQVLLRDLWTTAVYHWLPSVQSSLLRWSGGNVRQADNLLLAAVLLLALPLLLQRDLHALRHTCYIGFSSCVLLFGAVSYRAYQKVQLPHAHNPIKWYTTDPSDILFAYPIVLLCFFCSFNVLSIHSQLRNPTRRRVRALLDGSMLLCWTLFYGVGLGGYLYAGQDALDNILLNFPMSDPAIFAGRSGYCLTILFGLPLVLLPLRDAVVGLPGQVSLWRENANFLVARYQHVGEERPAGAHFFFVNGVDFDSEEPKLQVMNQEAGLRHGTRLSYGSTGAPSATVPPTITNLMSDIVPSRVHHATETGYGQLFFVGDNREVTTHVLSTVALLLITFCVAASVPGVAVVWSIFGSSMAIWIGFIVPTTCYLKIRDHKVWTVQSLGGALLLGISCLSAVTCTRHALQTAFS